MNPKNVRKKKKRLGGKIFLTVLLCLFVLIGIAAFVFREEIRLLYFAMTTSEEAVQSQQVENDRKTHELLEEIAVQTMRDLTEEERKLLASGELSPEQAIALIQGMPILPPQVETTSPIETTAVITAAVTVPATEEPTVSEPVQTRPAPITTAEPVTTPVTTPATTVTTTVTTTATTTATTATTAKVDAAALQNRQSEIIAEIYLLRATYLNEIDALIQEMKDEFDALPKEQRNLSGKMMIAEKTLPKGNALEDECDAKMQALLDELTGILKSLGSSTAIIGEIEKTYEEQKMLKKTELYNRYVPK